MSKKVTINKSDFPEIWKDAEFIKIQEKKVKVLHDILWDMIYATVDGVTKDKEWMVGLDEKSGDMVFEEIGTAEDAPSTKGGLSEKLIRDKIKEQLVDRAMRPPGATDDQMREVLTDYFQGVDCFTCEINGDCPIQSVSEKLGVDYKSILAKKVN